MMVKLRFKHEYIGLKVFETLVNRSADYANHFMVDAPGIYAKEHRGNKGRGMVYCTLTDMMTARAVPLNVLRVSRSDKMCITLVYFTETFEDLESTAPVQTRVIENMVQFVEAMKDKRRIMSVEIAGPDTAFIIEETYCVGKDTAVGKDTLGYSKYSGDPAYARKTLDETVNIAYAKEKEMSEQTFVQAATQNIANTSKTVVNDAIDVATGMAAVEVIKQIAFSIMPVKVGFVGRLMGANSWVKDNPFVTLGIVTVVHTILKSSNGRLTVNDSVMEVADNALRYATFKAVEAFPIQRVIQDLSDKLVKISK
ncbi:FAA hydrolase family protein [Aeromonas phage AhSzq-1]|uniref:FAA hydrolase family protein n=1 Tax=Aeromonas phage AhSzq-1 TaxID=2138298 RepID=A0A2R4ALJ9_9CAUD|nr:FAA hydrolase family protein [Aeromonas phage AhSzq-1]AVR75929.1 FAA hydrolase family protein [Aeromonas phage AhSzq-1]